MTNLPYAKKKVSENCIYHEATKDELHKVAVDFANSALRCKEAGVDGVQIHGAHGYLINSFLSPSTNYRTDEYGGKIENRARILFEVYDAIRRAVGDDFIIGVKFPFSDLNENSIKPEESIFVCKELEKRGINFIEVSSGMVMDNSSASFTPVVRNDNQAPFLKYASQLACQVAIPIISVCGYRTPDMVEKALSETKISAVSFGRPLVREPNLPNRWKKTDVLQCVFLAIVAVILWGTKLLLVKLRNKAKYRDEQFSSLPSEMQAGNKARTGRKSVVGIFPV